jgi:hypothetical protein
MSVVRKCLKLDANDICHASTVEVLVEVQVQHNAIRTRQRAEALAIPECRISGRAQSHKKQDQCQSNE